MITTNYVHLNLTDRQIRELCHLFTIHAFQCEDGTMFQGECFHTEITYNECEDKYPTIVDLIDNQAYNADDPVPMSLSLEQELYPLLKKGQVLVIIGDGPHKAFTVNGKLPFLRKL